MNEYCSMSTDVYNDFFHPSEARNSSLTLKARCQTPADSFVTEFCIKQPRVVLTLYCHSHWDRVSPGAEGDPARLGQVGTNGLSYTYWISRIYYSYGVQFKFSLKMSPSFIRGNNINKCRMSYSKSGEHLERRKIVRGVNLYFNWVFHPPTARGLYIRKYKIISESIMGLV